MSLLLHFLKLLLVLVDLSHHDILHPECLSLRFPDPLHMCFLELIFPLLLFFLHAFNFQFIHLLAIENNSLILFSLPDTFQLALCNRVFKLINFIFLGGDYDFLRLEFRLKRQVGLGDGLVLYLLKMQISVNGSRLQVLKLFAHLQFFYT